ncbi:hypothetical protein G7Y89_g10689 [Cudoniella acicularis]|uniref:Uncharacterized protein n=1 Tax=Cudoniella acicularis TaxID=354080 RepID=A0A8H4W1C8_9HELO|nr:hypothetical protein G7Y89_g10689 [Cudoniella acicularis]
MAKGKLRSRTTKKKSKTKRRAAVPKGTTRCDFASNQGLASAASSSSSSSSFVECAEGIVDVVTSPFADNDFDVTRGQISVTATKIHPDVLEIIEVILNDYGLTSSHGSSFVYPRRRNYEGLVRLLGKCYANDECARRFGEVTPQRDLTQVLAALEKTHENLNGDNQKTMTHDELAYLTLVRSGWDALPMEIRIWFYNRSMKLMMANSLKSCVWRGLASPIDVSNRDKKQLRWLQWCENASEGELQTMLRERFSQKGLRLEEMMSRSVDLLLNKAMCWRGWIPEDAEEVVYITQREEDWTQKKSERKRNKKKRQRQNAKQADKNSKSRESIRIKEYRLIDSISKSYVQIHLPEGIQNPETYGPFFADSHDVFTSQTLKELHGARVNILGLFLGDGG